MKLIDVTAYFGKWPYWPISVTKPEELIGLMHRWDICQAVVAPLRSVFLTCEDGQNELMELIKTYPSQLIGFIIVDPKDEQKALEQIDFAYQNGCKGLRLFPQHHQYRLDDDPILEAIFDLAQTYQFVVQIPSRIMLHWGLPQFDVREVDHIAGRFPDLQIIIGGINYSELRDAIGVMRHRPNVNFETSCMQMANGIETLVEKVSAERVLFGTGLPLQYASPGIAKIEHSLIKDKEKELIFSKNAKQLLGL